MSIDKAELAQIQALAANLAAEPSKPPVSQYASEEDIADVADVLDTVTPDDGGEEETPSAEAVKELAAAIGLDDDPIEKFLASSREKRGGIHEAQTKAERILKEAEEKAASILQKAEAALQEKAQRLLSSMLQDPMAAAQEFRVDPDAVIRATAESQDPNARLMREVRHELAKKDSEVGELRKVVQSLLDAREEEKRTAQRENFNRVQQKFLDDADPDNFPAVNMFWGRKRFLGEAYEESQAIHEAASVLGGRPEISDKQIVARLERRAREELKANAKGILALLAKLEKEAAPPAPAEKTGKAAKTLPPSASAASTKTAAAASAKKKFASDREEHEYLVKVAQGIIAKSEARKPKVA